MKKILTLTLTLIALIGLLALPVLAVDIIPTPPMPSLPTAVTNPVPPAPNLLDYLTTGSNYFAVPFLTYSLHDRSIGGGIALGYHLSEIVAPVLRVDYFDSRFYSVSLTANLQPPRALLGKIPIVPFALAGGAMPFAGGGDDNGTFVTVIGAGAYVPLSIVGKSWWLKNSSIIADYEKWFGMPANQTDQFRVGWSLRF